MELLIATGNRHKLEQLQALLERPLRQVELELPELQAIAVRDVIEAKALAAYAEVGRPVLVEDTGLYIAAWNGLPGALVRWFLDAAGVDGICRMLRDFENLSAYAETCIGFYDGATFQSFCGRIDGAISRRPRGANGFGWDPIFEPAGGGKTFAEMTAEDKQWNDMRAQAARKLRHFLEDE